MEMSMEASEEMATQMTPRAMARAELVASAILPAVSELVRTRARVAQCAAAQAWSRLLSERLPEERAQTCADVRGGSGMVWAAVGTTAGGEGFESKPIGITSESDSWLAK